MKLTFYGGAKSVTGANYLLDTGSKKIMVDCGLFQGSKYAEDLNYEKFAYNPSDIDAVFITHSHADHSGRLPKLWKEGFRGIIYTTEPTKELISTAMPDNLNLIKEEATMHNHEPLFNQTDLERTLPLIKPVKYYERIELGNDIYAKFHNAGHILGSAIIELGFGGKIIFFSGDLGNYPSPLLPAPNFPEKADYVVVESAYGSRTHENAEQRKDILEDVIEETVSRRGVLIIPSFAIERTQELLFELNELVSYNRIPKVPVFIDSPLAIKMTEVYKKFTNYFNNKALETFKMGRKLFEFPGLKFTPSVKESKMINDVPPPKIIIAGSGMSNGGRILHHEKRYLPDPKSAILFIGYQIRGSLGRRILEGNPEVSIFGEKVPVNCHIKAVGAYSSHADQPRLLDWIEKAGESKNGFPKLKRVFVVQGEEESAAALALKIRNNLKINSTVPEQGQEFEL